jgi:hypothetical protein
MSQRIPASERTREALSDLIEGRLSIMSVRYEACLREADLLD